MVKYVKEIGRIGEILKAGISSIKTNEDRTIVKTPAGSYVFPTKEFNKVGGYESTSPLFAAEMGINLGTNTNYSGQDSDYKMVINSKKTSKFPHSYIV